MRVGIGHLLGVKRSDCDHSQFYDADYYWCFTPYPTTLSYTEKQVSNTDGKNLKHPEHY